MTYADGRYGALDIGTVTCRLLVADVEDGRIIDVDKEYAITDLGVGVDATGRLSEAAIEPGARLRGSLLGGARTLRYPRASRATAHRHGHLSLPRCGQRS